jgi:hypothetical protein
VKDFEQEFLKLKKAQAHQTHRLKMEIQEKCQACRPYIDALEILYKRLGSWNGSWKNGKPVEGGGQ